jgi:membrane protease YdiL (CAAX protease family)
MALARDLLVFNAVTGLAAVHFLIKTRGTPMEQPTWVYLLIWVMSLILLLWLRLYHGERGDLTDYDENLRRDHLPILLGSVFALLVVNSLAVSGLLRSVLYIPRPGLALNLNQLSLASLVDDLLYNFVLVAPAEESVKLMGMLTLYRKTGNTALSVGLPVGVWAVLHAYQAYVGEMMPALVLGAFVSGLVLFAVLKYTSSLENAMIAHGLYNSVVILSSLLRA